jgi:hypothetical protein
MRYDGEPPEEDFDDIETYAGKIYNVLIKDQKSSIITFPDWWHLVVLGDDGLEPCLSEDLQAGMAIQVGGSVGLIDDIQEGLYCGLQEGVFLGEPQDEDHRVERKKFVREVFKSGKLNWKMEGPLSQFCPACGKKL